jgi:hypothetical protein
MAIRARHQGFISDLFNALSHPTVVALTAVTFMVSALMGYEISHPLFQFSATFMIASMIASSLKSSRREVMLIGAIGLSITSIGLVSNVQSMGSIVLQPRQTVEAYQRGHHTPVDHHLGGPLSFEVDSPMVRFTFDQQPSMFKYQEFVSGSPMRVGPWAFKFISQRGDMKTPSVTLKFQHRTTNEVETAVLCVGESKLIGKEMVVRVDQALNNPSKGNQASNLQVALYAQWKDQNDQAVQKPIYLQSSFPELDKRFGQSPYLMTVEGIKPTPKFKLSVQHAAQARVVEVGIVLLLLALLILIIDTLRTQAVEDASTVS